MGSEQQFCLRWNNHQSTLISVFDTLLESETLVDVTLAAEGQYLKAHKVVLSACSQYFQELLCHHLEKHPIIILKDVTFQELKALIDYMYRGEVNVSQEQLSALIKTAESLKIKGLADGGDRRPDRKSVPQLSPPLPPVLAPALSGNLSLDSRSMGAGEYATNSPLQHAPREGSISPVSRKRKRIRRRSGDGVGGGGTHEGDVGGGSEQASSSASTISVPNIPATITPVNSGSRTTPGEGDGADEEGVSGSKVEGEREDGAQGPASSKQTKSEPGTSLQSHSQTPLLEPKSEYREEDDDDGEADEDSMDNVVALDEDVMDMEGSRDDGLDQKPGPSHGAEVSGQGSGFAPWHMMPDRSGDDIFIPSQEAAAQRESQEPFWKQPNMPSTMKLKIASVQSGNMSDWFAVQEPGEPYSRTMDQRDMENDAPEMDLITASRSSSRVSNQAFRMGNRGLHVKPGVARLVGYLASPSRNLLFCRRGFQGLRIGYPVGEVANENTVGEGPSSSQGISQLTTTSLTTHLPYRQQGVSLLKRRRGRPRGSGRGRVITSTGGVLVYSGDGSGSLLPGQGLRRPRGRPRGSRLNRSQSLIEYSSNESQPLSGAYKQDNSFLKKE